MTSTELKVGLSMNGRTSSRVLKPPGGGHSNIFAEAEVSVNAPRPKYNQQNSTNLNACLGSTDANVAVEKLREEIAQTVTSSSSSAASSSAAALSSTITPAAAAVATPKPTKLQTETNDNNIKNHDTIAKETNTNQMTIETSNTSATAKITTATTANSRNGDVNNGPIGTNVKGRVPPGGYSSGGFW